MSIYRMGGFIVIIDLRGEKYSHTMEKYATYSRINELKETKEDRRESESLS